MKRTKAGKINKSYLKRLEIVILCPACNKDFIDKEWHSFVICPYCKTRLISKYKRRKNGQ